MDVIRPRVGSSPARPSHGHRAIGRGWRGWRHGSNRRGPQAEEGVATGAISLLICPGFLRRAPGDDGVADRTGGREPWWRIRGERYGLVGVAPSFLDRDRGPRRRALERGA